MCIPTFFWKAELSTESSLSTDSLGDSLSLRLIIIDSDDEEPPTSPKASQNPGRKGRPVGSKPISHKNPTHAASLPTGPNTPVSRERACQPWATMRSAGHGDGFYVVMNGRIMGVFNSWYGEETYSSLMLNCLQGILLRGRIPASHTSHIANSPPSGTPWWPGMKLGRTRRSGILQIVVPIKASMVLSG